MRILYLTLKSKWYDMIAAGEKPEEYRAIKSYWIKRLLIDVETKNPTADMDYLIENIATDNVSFSFQDFTHVRFARGGHFHPAIPQMTIELNEFVIGQGKQEWGAEPSKNYLVIKLGNIL